MRQVLIAVPTFESILPETFKSIYGLDIPVDTQCQFDFVKGYDCARARTAIADEAVQYGFDYVLMVDSDVILPSNTLVDLLEGDPEVVLGIYPRKNTTTGQTEIFLPGHKDFVDANNLNLDKLDTEPYSGRFEAKGGGLGCALIKVDILKKIPKPWFNYVMYPNGNVLSEDNFFCDRATGYGFKIQADGRVRCAHLVRTFIR